MSISCLSASRLVLTRSISRSQDAKFSCWSSSLSALSVRKEAFQRSVFSRPAFRVPVRASGVDSGLYSSRTYQLNPENVNLVLDDVRPYLISDGGDVEVVSVIDGVVSLKLQGACETCPSSTTTMKMGIERVLKENFGDQIKDIVQVFEEQSVRTTVDSVNAHLDILRPAIKNYGGSVEVISVDGGDCTVKYVGPDSIGSGIKAAIKEKFPDIVNVIFN
ncbi:nifU-like protein 1, chloroplastic [Nymphaea colorata]|nr:nifU-like protein 1, chloroplastic [Nymphaea colorata]